MFLIHFELIYVTLVLNVTAGDADDHIDEDKDETYPECDHDEYQLSTGWTNGETKTFIRAHASQCA